MTEAGGGRGAGPGAAQPGRSTPELAAAADLNDEAKALLAAGDPGPRAFIGQLIEARLFPEAVKLLAHALPKRESVWWAWVCARKAAGAEPPPLVAEALASTERWIVQPTDDNRRAAMAAGEKVEIGTPSGCAALAAFLSMGSVAPPHVQEVLPPEHSSAKAVAGSVTLSAVVKAKEAEDRFREYIGLGLEVADRTKLWAA